MQRIAQLKKQESESAYLIEDLQNKNDYFTNKSMN